MLDLILSSLFFFTELAPPALFKHKVAMSGCLYVCQFVYAIGCSFFRPLNIRKEKKKKRAPFVHFCPFWYWCYYPHRLRDSVSPIFFRDLVQPGPFYKHLCHSLIDSLCSSRSSKLHKSQTVRARELKFSHNALWKCPIM